RGGAAPVAAAHGPARPQGTAVGRGRGSPLPRPAGGLHRRRHPLTRRSEVVLAPAAVRPGHAPHDAGVLELLETSGEEGGRHERHTPVEVAEATAPAEQLAQDERGPSLGDDLGCLGDRAELAVPLHPGPSVVDGRGRRNSIFCTFRPARREPCCRSQGGATWLLDQLSRLSAATPPLSTMRPSPTWRNNSVESSSVPGTRSTRP